MIKPEIELGTQKWTAAELRHLLLVERDAILADAAQRAEQDYCFNPEAMNMSQLPKGWDEQRVKQLLTELDARTDDEWIAADEAAVSEEGEQSVITVPTALLPEIRRILATAKSA